MKSRLTLLLSGLVVLVAGHLTAAQTGGLRLPGIVEAGTAFSIQSPGNGKAVLYIVGPGQVLRRNVELGETTSFAPGDLHNAGHYRVLLVGGSSTENRGFGVRSAHPTNLSFIAKPSRLPVDLHDGISGVVYVFDTFHNLVLQPTPVSFQLSGVAGAPQTRTVVSKNGLAWTKLDSASKEGAAQFEARAGNVADKRIIQQVPGDPCKLKMDVRAAGQRLQLETEPVRDCSGNAVPDGTIVTFTEIYAGGEATVDVPLKRGVAKTEMPAYKGATISVATGVVMGNEIRWGKE